MIKYLCFLLVVPALFIECRTKSIEDYSIIIRPIGPSDATRMTFFISLKKTKFKKDNPFVDEILTDENSLQNTISFIEDNIPAKNDRPIKAGWGSLEISEYNAKKLIIHYCVLNNDPSRNYLSSLIKSLENKNSDVKLIKALKEALSELPYTFR